jgi:chloramphenicol 3-O phosphotransferase
MATKIIVLNGGSSSGKTGIARCLQAILPEPWLRFGVDELIAALPPALTSSGGVTFGPAGEVSVGDGFRVAEAAWLAGIAAMARAGARVIVDDVFLSGAASQARYLAALEGLEVLWAGVRCEAAVAVGREMARGNRVTGMAESQAVIAHDGVVYDIEVDTTSSEALDCARLIAARVER